MPGWDGVAEAYAATFAPLCAGTLDAVLAAAGVAQTAPGTRSPAGAWRLLDVGAGTGALAARARARGAEVTAVDPDAAMLQLARQAVPDVSFARAGLPVLPFPDESFEAVVANFVVNHVPDPRAGVRELARVAAPGGRVVVTIWPSGANAQSRLWADVIADSGALAPASVRLPPERDFERTVEGLADLLRDAGLSDVQSRSLTWTHRAEVDSLWQGAAGGVGGIGTTVTAQPDAVRRAMKESYDVRVRDLVEDGRLRLDTEALIAVGRRAARHDDPDPGTGR